MQADGFGAVGAHFAQLRDQILLDHFAGNGPEIAQCLFAGGIATVCQPVNLHRIADPHPRITALPLVVSGVTQLPCRVIAEWK